MAVEHSVTAEHVAERAGVSRWTVARAFKKDASISKRSRERVLAAAEALGYVPDLVAAGLAADRSHLVALIFDDFENPHKLVILERLTRILQAHGWGALLFNTRRAAGVDATLMLARQRRVDAAILIGTQFDDAILASAQSATRIRKLIVFARESREPATVSIACDDETAMADIAALVWRKGRRRPLFLAGPDTFTAGLFRKQLFQEHWRRLGGGDVAVASVGQYNSELAYACVLKLFQTRRKRPAIDVLVCENDIIAIGAMDALRYGLGFGVPGDIAVVGYDDIPLAATPSYALTTYRQPITAMAERLVAILEDEFDPASASMIPGRLVERSSI